MERTFLGPTPVGPTPVGPTLLHHPKVEFVSLPG
jgi:hypothetical protein